MALYWLIGGIVLMVAELVIPGGVVVFLGAGALVVSLLLWVGLVEHWMAAFTSWFVISLILILALRGLVQRFTGGDEDWQPSEDDAEAMGALVTVTETIRPGQPGRISYRGTTWPAICHDRELTAGAQAKLVYRDNLAWIVEPATDALEVPTPDGN